MACSLALTLLLALPGQPLSTGPIVPAPPLSEDAAVRLAYMKDTVAAYRIHRRAAGSPLFKLRAEPIFRLDNPVTGVKDSAIFFWTDPETGRPEATIQMFRAPTKYWIHDWTSLSTSPIVAEVGRRAEVVAEGRRRVPSGAGCPGSRGNSRGPAPPDPSLGRGVLGHRRFSEQGMEPAPAHAETVAPLRQGRFGGRGRCAVCFRTRNRARGRRS